jgi:excisionase family DNA binding protein
VSVASATPAPTTADLAAAISLDGLPLVLTVAEAAVVLRVSRTTAYKLAEEWRTSGGRSGLPVIRLGRRLVVRRVDLAALVEGPASAA